MAQVTLVGFREGNGNVPILGWIESLPKKARVKCRVRIERLREMGIDLRRPEADYLRDGIYELRFKHQRVNYRVLYFFHGRTAVVVSHGLQKEKAISPKEIDVAVERMNAFLTDPPRHSAGIELP